MFNIEEVSIQLDLFYKERLQIYDKLKNELEHCKEVNESLYCETLLVFLYAQLEGYVTDVLLYYIEIINSLNLKVKDVSCAISASSKCPQFESYEEHIKNKRLSKYEGRVKFLNNFNDLLEHKVNLSNSLINTESNLKQKVLEDLMIKLGFPSDRFARIGNILDNFVNERNNVAHGNNQRTKLTCVKYQIYEKLVKIDIMQALKDLIFDSIEKENYLNK